MSIPDFDRLFDERETMKIAKIRIGQVILTNSEGARYPGPEYLQTVVENGNLVHAEFKNVGYLFHRYVRVQ